MIVSAEIADVATQALTEVTTQKSLADLGDRVAEGTANGLLMIRLGAGNQARTPTSSWPARVCESPFPA